MNTAFKKATAKLAALGLISAAAGFVVVGNASVAEAASCWYHNGSLMRVTAGGGGSRTMKYVTTPHSWQARAGVYPGTVLFTGHFDGARYSGNARRFSKGCPGSPQHYYVSGPANSNRIILRGRYNTGGCAMNGRMKNDRLVFTFSHAC